MKKLLITCVMAAVLAELVGFELVAAVQLELYWDTGDIGVVHDIEVADLDMDGMKETIVALELGYGVTSPIVIYDGVSQAVEHTIWLPLGNANQIEVADVDGDGITELIVGSTTTWEQGEQGYIYIYNGTTYDLEWESENIGAVASLHVEDFDLDGVKEIFAGIGFAPVQQNFGRILVLDGITHAIEFSYDLATHFVFCEGSTVCNLDDDPALEIIFGTRDREVSHTFGVYVMDGLTHDLEEKWGGSGEFRGCITGDVDNDGQLEIIVGHIAGTSAEDLKQIKVFSTDWGEECSYVFPPHVGWGPAVLAVGDVNGDIIPEIVVGTHLGTGVGNFSILDGQTCSLIWSDGAGGSVEVVVFGDVNNDGRAELCIGDRAGWSSGHMTVYEIVLDYLIIPLDIKPGSCPNPLNVKAPKDYSLTETDESSMASKSAPDGPQRARPVLPAGILGTADFNVTDIGPATVMLEGVPALRWNIEDVSTPVGEDAEECECNALGPDGYPDLTLKFDKSLIVEALGDVYNGDTIPLTITGELMDGTAFEGTDCVVIRGADDRPGGAHSAETPEVVLIGNFPNPFNPVTEISFSLPEVANVKLEIFNVMGQNVTTLLDDKLEAGEHIIQWDGSNVASGVYLYRLEAGEFVDTKKMILLK